MKDETFRTSHNLSLLHLSCCRTLIYTQLSEQPQKSQPSIDIQKDTCSYIACHHVVPLADIPEVLLANPTVSTVDMAKVCECHSKQIVASHTSMSCPATDHGHYCNEQEHVAHLKCHRKRLRCEFAFIQWGVGSLVGKVLERIRKSEIVCPDTGQCQLCDFDWMSGQDMFTVQQVLGFRKG